MMSSSKPLLALTQGDPAGVGPEIVVAAWADAGLQSICRPLAVGNLEVFRRAAKLWGIRLEVVEITDPVEVAPSPTRMPCLAAGGSQAADVPAGRIDPRGGQAALESVVAAVRLAQAGRIDGLVTGPLSKAALHAAGHDYPGHTELLGDLCRSDRLAMMLYLGPQPDMFGPAGLGVVHVTLHMALADALRAVTSDRIAECITLAGEALQRLGAGCLTDPPRIGVCALNPHAGEEGLFGNEEQEVIMPAVLRCRRQGFEVSGPYPADTLMARARDAEFDAVVAMYHDQGHIALKLLGMHQAVNVTLGLPIVRTSVAHGTAFDLAWQAKAETTGLIEAVRVAVQLADVHQQDRTAITS
ncbi:MAG: 4-hydroxythreonine-4-phosphate dehydrogenase PdxA [Planctomycetales bacterium]|nr:4-hydroxythreonine-4-phosphate dehydrogenase PdxA [Planctomycetales bacterium]NIM10265.1 4-hydroxythreonine-4-phosphate dehydrogenase PdxA [Planctomycetales bacterium]NIN09703.1 4-hydroxythreonine-4-phosphate dehydrogenase PdxA [Planctomycetales bacterium]NIN78823.1 4-hydroxythreonine-4-phosphate dehydrogenase PdxA [Planctomycetales bacterium]NIO35994.1 4-hydroxythreonine-4-phosphate dehydrogenase PdxA [Planctomycetales bacterium]